MIRSRDTGLNQGFPSFAFGRTRQQTVARPMLSVLMDQTEPASLIADNVIWNVAGAHSMAARFVGAPRRLE